VGKGGGHIACDVGETWCASNDFVLIKSDIAGLNDLVIRQNNPVSLAGG
jgi:hypothetical protein